MSRRLEFFAAALLGLAPLVLQAQSIAKPDYAGVGRAATPKEVAAWDIDVRPDFKGLPKGSGSVAKGMEVWEGKCASCHGVFGESNEVFSPIVGGTTQDDLKTGRVARLNDSSFPGRTTLMKVSTVSTLWDYINRAMPWAQPKSLTTEEVYAVTAYLLSLGGVVADDFTLTDKNIGEVQKRLPNRHGTTTDHALWPGPTFGKHVSKVSAVACMRDCPIDDKLDSSLPEFARNAHGNLAEQNRAVGAQRGADTSRPVAAGAVAAAMPAPAAAAAKPTADTATATAATASAPGSGAADAVPLLQKYACTACHGMEARIVGPGFREIAKKYEARADASAYLASKVKAGSAGVWGAIPMPAQSLTDAEAKTIAGWLAGGAIK